MQQEELIKMVRRHPTLRWLQSDLSNENVVMLKQERPDTCRNECFETVMTTTRSDLLKRNEQCQKCSYKQSSDNHSH